MSWIIIKHENGGDVYKMRGKRRYSTREDDAHRYHDLRTAADVLLRERPTDMRMYELREVDTCWKR